MKKLIVTLLCYYTVINFAYSKEKNNWQIHLAYNDAHSQLPFYAGVNLNIDEDGNMINGGAKKNASLSLSLIQKYYFADDWALRLEYGHTQISLRNHRDKTDPSTGFLITPNYVILYDSIDQSINRLSAGVQWIFFKNRKIQSYGGTSLMYIHYSEISEKEYSETRKYSTDSLIYWGSGVNSVPGGFATGLGVFAGFDIFITKKICLGAEFTSSLLYYNVGGNELTESKYQAIPGSVLSGTQTNIASYRGIRFAHLMSSFNISFYF